MGRACEGAVAALDEGEMLARAEARLALAGERQPPVVKMNLDVAAGDAGKLRRDDVVVGRLVQIDRRFPPGMSGRESIQALLDGQQVANRIPAREGHDSDAS